MNPKVPKKNNKKIIENNVFLVNNLVFCFYCCCFCLLFWCLSCLERCGRPIRSIPTKWRVKLWGCVRAMFKKPKTYLKINFTHFVSPHFSRLTVRIERFRPENRIPDAQLYHFPAGKVWNHEVESKHHKNVFEYVFLLNSFMGL